MERCLICNYGFMGQPCYMIQPHGPCGVHMWLITRLRAASRVWCSAILRGPLGCILLTTECVKKGMYLWSVDEFIAWHTVRNLKIVLNAFDMASAKIWFLVAQGFVSLLELRSLIKPEALSRRGKQVVWVCQAQLRSTSCWKNPRLNCLSQTVHFLIFRPCGIYRIQPNGPRGMAACHDTSPRAASRAGVQPYRADHWVVSYLPQ